MRYRVESVSALPDVAAAVHRLRRECVTDKSGIHGACMQTLSRALQAAPTNQALNSVTRQAACLVAHTRTGKPSSHKPAKSMPGLSTTRYA
jgi:hypothetical protein